jgi:hypothetical protein
MKQMNKQTRYAEVLASNKEKTVEKTQKPLPKLWLRLSETQGNIVQLGGLILGAGLLYLAAHLMIASSVRVVLMLLGFVVIYICCHAIAHWAVGRLVGIRFRGYGVRGTDHPELYPPIIRQIMSIIPFFSALTEKASMQQANPWAKALMFSAGETSTNICSLLAAAYAWLSGIPGGSTLFMVIVIWDLSSTIVTSIIPRGDYAKAIRTLRAASHA